MNLKREASGVDSQNGEAILSAMNKFAEDDFQMSVVKY
jgi:hypothetical protein